MTKKNSNIDIYKKIRKLPVPIGSKHKLKNRESRLVAKQKLRNYEKEDL